VCYTLILLKKEGLGVGVSFRVMIWDKYVLCSTAYKVTRRLGRDFFHSVCTVCTTIHHQPLVLFAVDLYHGLFIPWTIHTIPGLFVPWAVHTMDCSNAGLLLPGILLPDQKYHDIFILESKIFMKLSL